MSNQGPWGGGDDEEKGKPQRPTNRPNGGEIPEIDEIMKRGTEQLKVLMGGRGGKGNGRGPMGGGQGPNLNRSTERADYKVWKACQTG